MVSPPQNNKIISHVELEDVFIMSSPIKDTTGGSALERASDGLSPKHLQGSQSRSKGGQGDGNGNSTAVPVPNTSTAVPVLMTNDQKSPQTPSTPEKTPYVPGTADRAHLDRKAYNNFSNFMKFGTPPPFDPKVPLSQRPLRREFPYEIPVNWREEEEAAAAEEKPATLQTHRNFRAERQAAQARRDEKRKARKVAKSNDTSHNTSHNTPESKDKKTTEPSN